MPLILLHAFPLNRGMWEAQLESWGRHFRVIAPDFRGFGESPLGEEDSRMESFADDVRHLLGVLKVQDRVVMLGLSMGGYVAFEFARKYGDRLRGLVLVATQPINDSAESRRSRYELADLIRSRGIEVLIERMMPKLLGKTSLESRPEVVERVRRLIAANTPKGMAKACYALASRRDSTPVLNNIAVPTLIVAGAEDPIVPKGQLEVMNKGIRQSQLVVLEKSGHLGNLEKAGVFNSMVQEFGKVLL
jgi:pimeloyl-ACP methyl ester carboxylesterase